MKKGCCFSDDNLGLALMGHYWASVCYFIRGFVDFIWLLLRLRFFSAKMLGYRIYLDI